MRKTDRIIASLLSGVLVLSSFSGCANGNTAAPDTENEAAVITEAAATTIPTTFPETEPSEVPETVPAITEPADLLTEEQGNSLNMLNFLTLLTQEINTHKNNRLFLETAYSQLLNTRPDVVDAETLKRYDEILDMLTQYRMLGERRERLEYLHEKQLASAIRAAVPDAQKMRSFTNAIGSLSPDNPLSVIKALVSLGNLAVSAVSDYQAYQDRVDIQFLQDGWELDDQETMALHESRKRNFDHQVKITGQYNLPGEQTLSEKNIEEFVEWRDNDNVVRRIQFLENNQKTYQALGLYWLVLAESYYENGNYQGCLDAVTTYESMDNRIFRRDSEYADILPMAMASAAEVLTGDAYISTVERYLQRLYDNTENKDWFARYFAAQMYISLYGMTQDETYLQNAYGLVLNNVNHLVTIQEELNDKYLAELVLLEIPEEGEKTEKKQIKEYNKLLEEARSTELPPAYEPLMLNCDLLFALVEQLKVPEAEKEKIQSILHGGDMPLFLAQPMDSYYSYEKTPSDIQTAEVIFEGSKITLPASLVSDATVIQVAASANKTLADWTVTEVERTEEGLDSFLVTYKSEEAKEFEYAPDMDITLSLYMDSSLQNKIEFHFRTVNEKYVGVIPHLEFERVK